MFIIIGAICCWLLIVVYVVCLHKCNIKHYSGNGAHQSSPKYPYVHKYTTPEIIRQRFENLANTPAKYIEHKYRINNMPQLKWHDLQFYSEETDCGSPLILIHYKDDYTYNEEISVYFIEDILIDARRWDQAQTPREWWEENGAGLAKLPPKEQSDAIYAAIPVQVGIFKPHNMTALMQRFGARDVLDFSSGWGDRLIGFMAARVENSTYVGVDPNSRLHPEYARMIEFFKPQCAPGVNIKMICAPFESCNLDTEMPNQQFDMILTSPPYFKLEIYSDESTQSSHLSTVDEWLNGFLFPALDKAWSHLRVGGTMCININDYSKVYGNDINSEPSEPYTARMIEYVNKRNDSLYLGCLAYVTVTANRGEEISPNKPFVRNPQPFWIWRKIPAITRETISPPAKILELNYEGRQLNVIDEGVLRGGSKQRMYKAFESLVRDGVNEILYFGYPFGAANAAIGVIAKFYGIRATIFTNGFGKFIARAKMLGINVHIHEGKNSRELSDIVDKYRAGDQKIFVCPFGFDDDRFLDCLGVELKANLPPAAVSGAHSHWLVGGSGAYLRTLHDRVCAPGTYFNVLVMGKEFQNIDPTHIIMKHAKTSLREATTDLPPYKSVAAYDAKIWAWAREDAKSGDYIWNIAAIDDPVD